ncbi:histidine kinase [Halovibrio salipaludis]|uniref:histidine kinase n=1 Tax=Halovibrio salipaludis TaxID=2032626 RepID=A0A2A2FC54_9GAMM|nr:GAF domain-containing protein [Halovibrio salipaludis]PAU82420.1 histidine kinase [Halovibrio salipaludis]
MATPYPDENSRLAAVDRLGLMGTGPESAYDRLTELTRHLFGTRLALITLVGAERQWVKSRSGPDPIQDIPRAESFCTELIADDAPLICEDATQDPRFRDKPVVCGEPGIRFYAGIPLRPEGNTVVGSLCILDDAPRSLSESDQWTLTCLAQQAEELLRFQLARREQEEEHYQALVSNARYGALIAGASVGIIRVDSEGLIQDANPFALSLLGHSVDELQNLHLQRILPEFHLDRPDQPQITRETGALTRDGTGVPVQATLSRVSLADDSSSEFMVVLTDLSDIREAEAESRRERAFLRSIIDASQDPIYVKNREGVYLLANEASQILAHELGQEQVEGLTARDLYPSDVLEEAEAANERLLATGRPETLTFNNTDGRRFRISKSPLFDANDAIHGIVSVAHDVTEYLQMNEALRERERERDRQSQLLQVLHRGLTDYEALMSGDRLWTFLLDALRELTGSDYGLIGEVITNEQETSALKIHAITDLSWSPESRELMEQLRAGDMTLSTPDSLLGRVFAHGETIISSAPMQDDRGAGLPEGHPPLYSYMGVPIRHNGELIGMFAIANGAYDYDEAVLEWLEPFTATCALLINLSRHFEERDRFTRELAQARDQAEKASRAKSHFLSAMSHELRTPLNSILGFAQLLENSQRSHLDERQQRQVGQIQRSGQHLLELINEILDLARVESGRIQLSMEALCSGETAREALDTVAGMAETHGIEAHLHGQPSQWPRVHADFTRLKQVLLNLISNAIKYNRPEGQLRLFWTLEGDWAVLHCEDTGMGIDAGKLEQLFDPFDRLGADHSIEGTGIGLALTRRLVEAMGGWIDCVSEPGVGSDFRVHLALAETPATDATAPEKASTVARPENQSGRRRILYVEDNPANQRLMQEAFEEYTELELVCVHSAELGLDMVRSQLPDLVLMDLNLPGMDGESALGELRDDPVTRPIPVVAVSANAMREDIRRGMESGFVDYLTKPVDMNYLFEHLDEWIRNDPE